jgi:ribosomal protein L11 methyltransferase
LKNYTLIQFEDTKNQNDLLVAFLSSIDFDAFEEVNENKLVAYIDETLFNKENLENTIKSIPSLANLKYDIHKLENKNWNEEWEKSFKPIIVDNKCAVRASFHPQQNTTYEILIEPKMAFGTGHHATTEMMISTMLNLDFKNQKILDFGCGTSILAILAEKLGAKSIFANDIEEPAYENSLLNATINKCDKIEVALGGIEVVPNESFDVILANVNTNTILEYSKFIVEKLSKNGYILYSGILSSDRETIEQMTRILKLRILNIKEKNNWLLFLCQKID